jgi:hypothetical protein
MFDNKRIVPGSFRAKQNGRYIKVKERLKFSHPLGRPIVMGVYVPDVGEVGDIILKCTLYSK